MQNPIHDLWAAAMRTMGHRNGIRWHAPLCFAVGAALLFIGGPAHSVEPNAVSDMLLKVKPAVAIVETEVSARVRLTCPAGQPREVGPPSVREQGTGFLITPDGYLVTNGHVVQAYQGAKDAEHRDGFLRQAIDTECTRGGTSEQKQQRVDQLLPRMAPSAKVVLRKTLAVVLANRERYVAEVKAYSPPLAPKSGKQEHAETGPTESGKDIAILKIDARNLPTLALANSDRIQVGEPVHILGFPGAVMDHDLLSARSAVEATVTSGQISSLKQDARGAPVIQTDAAATWGSSGGPAVNASGDVIGILTFISLTADETQAIQGFNFLVPANIVREFARTAGADLTAASPFNAVWFDAVDRYERGDWSGAVEKLDAAARLVPNFPDVQRLQADVQLRLLHRSPWPAPAILGGLVIAMLLAVGGTWWQWRRVRRHRAARRDARKGADVSVGPSEPPSSVPSEPAPAPMAKTDVAPVAPPQHAGPQLETDVDLPVGIQGAGPYFNGRVRRLWRTGLLLGIPRPLGLGQELRLTIFLAGESMEVVGRVLSSRPPTSDGEPHVAEIAMDTLTDEQTTVLEGLILAERTRRSK